MEALAVPFLLLVGSLLALQAAANVQLATALTSPVSASKAAWLSRLRVRCDSSEETSSLSGSWSWK